LTVSVTAYAMAERSPATRGLRWSALLALVLALALPSGAIAEVHTDPSSPPNEEYAIPIDQARNSAGNNATTKTTKTDTQAGAAAGGSNGSGGDDLGPAIGIGIGLLAIGLGIGFLIRSRSGGKGPTAPDSQQ